MKLMSRGSDQLGEEDMNDNGPFRGRRHRPPSKGKAARCSILPRVERVGDAGLQPHQSWLFFTV